MALKEFTYEEVEKVGFHVFLRALAPPTEFIHSAQQ
jgi:hypothetical protein